MAEGKVDLFRYDKFEEILTMEEKGALILNTTPSFNDKLKDFVLEKAPKTLIYNENPKTSQLRWSNWVLT